ncbi:DAK2 domain-containing protein [Paenibacillus sp. J5C_2022]|uniref:DAK2 domain-containing protein n=1 Tax=Paenibacillus sp. J5C2022 TaxID=2977129 RepID=UPI0021D1501E|nr:DAK2 domain-containing protein [Paenibacillus sp. J5C2022]MCU6708942.1 DAK2 domain-containing protein [Paenibacillus sp. J5C2022]
MGKRSINGTDFAAMAMIGAELLQRNAEKVNALNVFPVPDGDTGTNMNLTMSSGVRELRSRASEHIGKTAEALSKGLLMGARGNSGVILSQLFRGFSKSLSALNEATAMELAAALQHGVDLAYKAVVKPVEGTILTVAKEAAKHAVQYARRSTNVEELMEEVHRKANEALARTPDLLPVLKQVGVVDSGGQGLVYIYEGFLRYLKEGEAGEYGDMVFMPSEAAPPEQVTVPTALSQITAHHNAQARLSTDEIHFPYDMEFFINRRLGSHSAVFFDESAFKRSLEKDGDSILVIVEDDIIKVHVHSRKPGDVINLALPYGELTDIHILNMREQHRELLQEDPASVSGADISSAQLLAGQAVNGMPPGQVYERAPYGIIAVALGEGTKELFRSNDVDTVLSGGQTMNPSTEDFLTAIDALSADHIFLLPNNSNIILAAEQAAELSERSVSVIPTRTIPQGLSAMLAFKEEEAPERNAEWMTAAAASVVSGQVTKAVRNTTMDGIDIQEGDYIGIREKTIVASDGQLLAVCQTLLSRMLEDDGDVLTVLAGEDAQPEITAALMEWVEAEYPDLDLDMQHGGQPMYPYLFAVE